MRLLLCMMLCLLTPAQPGEAPTPFERTLEAIDAKAAAIEDLVADFEQQKKTPLLKKPLVSRGTVRVKGAKTRWDTTHPHPTVMTIDASELRIYYPEQKTVEVYPIRAGMSRLAASPLPRLSVVREHFTIEETPAKELDPQAKPGEVGLRLAPREESLKEHVAQVRVLLDPATGVGRRVEITDAEGEVTTLTFTNVRANTGVREESLVLRTPPGTTESRPLEGGKPRSDR